MVIVNSVAIVFLIVVVIVIVIVVTIVILAYCCYKLDVSGRVASLLY